MPCETLRDQNGEPIGIVCSRTLRRCSISGCSAAGTKLCDWVIGPKQRTCDRRICAAHAHHVGPDRDYCPEHAST